MNTIKSIIKIVLSAIKGDWKGVLDGIMGIINGFRSYVSKTFENIMGTAKTLVFNGINTIKNIFHGLANINLMDAGRAIIDGFVRGLRSSWENGKKFVSGIASWIKDHKGPIEYDRKLLIPHGKAIMGGLNQSLMDEFKKFNQMYLLWQICLRLKCLQTIFLWQIFQKCWIIYPYLLQVEKPIYRSRGKRKKSC